MLLGNSMGGHSGYRFSTKDRDQDANPAGNCATSYKGGWWYSYCHRANLNGLYLGGPHESYANGVEWYNWLGYNYSLKRSEMKIRKRNWSIRRSCTNTDLLLFRTFQNNWLTLNSKHVRPPVVLFFNLKRYSNVSLFFEEFSFKN